MTTEDELALLRDRLRLMKRELFTPTVSKKEWDLNPRETQIFEILVRREITSKTGLFAAVYNTNEQLYHTKVLEPPISKMRAKLKPFGIEIFSKRFKGYYLDPAVRKSLIRGIDIKRF